VEEEVKNEVEKKSTPTGASMSKKASSKEKLLN